MDRGGGQVVSLQSFYSDDPSSILVECKLLENNANKLIQAEHGHF